MLVSVDSAQVFCVGHVPKQRQPRGAVRPEKEADLLWAIKGAGTNFGIIVSVTFKAYPSRSFSVTNWKVELPDEGLLLQYFAQAAQRLTAASSADAYVYYDEDQPMLGVTLFHSIPSDLPWHVAFPDAPRSLLPALGEHEHTKLANAVELFDTEMYVVGIHGDHGGGKTSSFKRCVFIKDIKRNNIDNILVNALKGRPSSMCYFQVLHGGLRNFVDNTTAFGCREWDFTCVITGLWPREGDDTPTARPTIRWVYEVVDSLLPVCQGVYSADLGPDPSRC